MSEIQTPVQDKRCQSGPSARKFSHPSWGRIFKELWSRPTTTADLRSSFRQIHHASNVCLLEDNIQDWGMYLFTISYGGYAVDQRSGVGWFSGWFKIFVSCKRNSNARFWGTRCEDCFSTEQNHPLYTLQKKGQPGGTKSPKRGPLSSWKTDRLPDLRVLPGHWSRWFRRELCRPSYNCSSNSGIRFEMGRNFIINDENPIWWHLGKLVQTKNTRVWETQDRIGIVQYGDSSEEDWTWLSQIEDNGKKEVSSKMYETGILGPETEILKQAPWSRIIGWNSVNKEFWEIVGNGKLTGSVHKETIAVSDTIRISVQNRHSRTLLQDTLRSRVWKNASSTRSPRGRSPNGRMSRWPCKDYLKGTCTNSFCEKWHPPECLFDKSKNGCRFGEKCSYAHRQVDEQPSKRSKKNGDKSTVAILKITRQLGCVFQDMEPPKSSSILRKRSNMLTPIRCFRFTEAVLRHADTRDQNPSLGMLCPDEPHQRSFNAPKFEDRSQEETEWQEEGAREAAWKLAKSVLKVKEKNKAAFFSPSDNRCLPASHLKPEERDFVVDSGASMHMISKKDLNYAEMDTLTKSCSPTIVITANGEVQTHEEATVYVKDLEFFLTMKVLESTPAVSSLGKLCDENGYSYEWINGQKPHLTEHGIRIQCNTENFVPIVVPGLSSSSSSSSHP